MKWHKTEYQGFKHAPKLMSGEGPGYKKGEVANSAQKTMGVMSGNAKTVWLHGIKLWVDEDGAIIRGPDLLIGLQFDQIKNVNPFLWMDVQTTMNRESSLQNNAPLSPAERAAAKQFEDAKIRLMKAIKESNQSRYDKISPGTVAQ